VIWELAPRWGGAPRRAPGRGGGARAFGGGRGAPKIVNVVGIEAAAHADALAGVDEAHLVIKRHDTSHVEALLFPALKAGAVTRMRNHQAGRQD
jgi:hypothetical protein